jgi:Lrp/AsnC family leucine-responsive transcriptional regulator
LEFSAHLKICDGGIFALLERALYGLKLIFSHFCLFIKGDKGEWQMDIKVMDQTDQKILNALIADSRMSQKELAVRVGLSAPAVSERVRRLEERGVIRGFTLDISPEALGYPLQAIVRIRPLPGKLHIVERLIQEIPEFGECDKVTGDDCYIARLYVRSIGELDTLLDRIVDKAETNTSIVKAKAVERRMPPFIRS